MKRNFGIFLAGIFIFSIFILSFILSGKNTDSGTQEIFMEIASGSSSGTEYQGLYYLSKKNGEEVDFYVENNGKTAIKISINDKVFEAFESGESGHAFASVTRKNQKFAFKVTPGREEGGTIDINYLINQNKGGKENL